MSNNIKKILTLSFILIIVFSVNVNALDIKNEDKINKNNFSSEKNIEYSNMIIAPIDTTNQDFDPLTDIEVTVSIKEIRALDKIDLLSDPDFYVKVYINNEVFTSKTWKNTNYVKNIDFSNTVNVPDNIENVNIKIELWDKNIGFDRLCDISSDFELFNGGKDVELVYNLRSGHWFGDDAVQNYLDWEDQGDPSGYGRLNGCDDGSIYQEDLDCEVFFEISQNDYDGDGIPYWSEVNIFHTDPEKNNIGEDLDHDGVPIEWEFKWGFYYSYDNHDNLYQGWFYDPFTWEDHSSLDFDEDGIDNVEEYKVQCEGFRNDPFRKDILLEIDQMKFGPNGEGSLIPESSKDLLWDAFSRHNILFQIDDQGQVIPFDFNTSGWQGTEMQEIYFKYFLDEDYNNWRRGVFHYAPIVYKSDDHPGNMWSSVVGDWDGTWQFSENRNDHVSIYGDCFQISTRNHDRLPYKKYLRYVLVHKTFDIEQQRAMVYATAMMHETGHVLGIYHSNVEGCDNRSCIWPWQKGYWIWRTYKSCMNYGYMYTFVDYSNGENGKYDNDDWNTIDLTLFQQERNPYFNGFE